MRVSTRSDSTPFDMLGHVTSVAKAERYKAAVDM